MVQSGIHNLIYFLLAAFFSHDSFEVMALVEIALFIFPKSEKKRGIFSCLKEGKRKLEGSTEMGESFVKPFKQTRSIRLLLQGTPLALWEWFPSF